VSITTVSLNNEFYKMNEDIHASSIQALFEGWNSFTFETKFTLGN
jgi:hypothetical protein